MARWTRRVGVLTIVIAITSIISAYIFYKQYDSMSGQQGIMQGQLNEMQAAERPWLKADISFQSTPVLADDGTILVLLNFSLKNYGTSPATNVHVLPTVIQYPDTAQNDHRLLDIIQKQACLDSWEAAKANPIGGITVFPSDTKVLLAPGFTRKTRDNPGNYSVLGCVDYTYGDGQHGRTGFRLLFQALVPQSNADSYPWTAPVTIKFFDVDPYGGNYSQ